MAEAPTEACIAEDLLRVEADKLARATVKWGALLMADKSSAADVCAGPSPVPVGGTTEVALKVLMADDGLIDTDETGQFIAAARKAWGEEPTPLARPPGRA